MKYDSEKKFKEYVDKFISMSDKQLMDAFNREVGNSGWISERALYLSALHEIFKKHGYDYSSIGNTESLSFKKRIKIIDKKIIIDGN